MTGQEILIFGAGMAGQRVLKALPKGKKAIAFVDNDEKKAGLKVKGLPVIGPDAIAEFEFDKILIASMHYSVIFYQLVDLGIPLDRIDIADSHIMNGLDAKGFWFYGVLVLGIAILALAVVGVNCLIHHL